MPANIRKEDVKQEDHGVDYPAKRARQEPADHTSTSPVTRETTSAPLKQAKQEVHNMASNLSERQHKLTQLLVKQEFDFSRFGEKSYFVIFQGLWPNAESGIVGKVSPSTKRAHVMHYLVDAWGLPQHDIIYAYRDSIRLIFNGSIFYEDSGTGTFADFGFERDGSDGDAEIVDVIVSIYGC